MPATTTTSLKLDRKMKERVQQLAVSRRRSAHWLLREAVEQYVEREEKRAELRRDALAAWDDYLSTGLHATGEEVDAWMGKLAAGDDAPPPACHK